MAKAKRPMGHAERANVAAIRGRKGRKKYAAEARRAKDDRTRQLARVSPLELTKATALEFVKLQAAGLPYAHVFHYLAPAWWALQDEDAAEAVVRSWLSSPMLAAAAVKFNGGAWQDLDKDTRIELALDKHASQLAYLLYTNNPNDADNKLALDKIKDAREALFEMQRLAQGGDQGAFAKMIADLLAGKVDGQATMDLEPPREQQPEGVEIGLGESVAVEMIAAKGPRSIN